VLDHLIYTGFHTSWEPAMRAIPILALAVAAALLAYEASRWWGTVAGLAAGAILATNPLVFYNGRAVRGYSLLLAMAIASSLVLIRMSRRGPISTWWGPAYVVLAAVGLMAHLYMLMVLGLQLVAGLSVPRLRDRRVPILAVVAGLIGMIVQYTPLVAPVPPAHQGRVFQPSFPASVLRDVLGISLVAIAVALVLIAVGAPTWWRRRPIPYLCLAAAGELAVVWFVAPVDLYTRFFIWVVPAAVLAIVAGAAELSRRGGVGAVGLSGWGACAVIVVAQAAFILPGATRPAIADRAAATVLEQASRNGARVCVLATSWESLLGYESARPVTTPAQLQRCDVVAAIAASADHPLLPRARAVFHHELDLHGFSVPATIFTNAPLQCLKADAARSCWPVPAH
jgi:hypothetical protein